MTTAVVPRRVRDGILEVTLPYLGADSRGDHYSVVAHRLALKLLKGLCLPSSRLGRTPTALTYRQRLNTRCQCQIGGEIRE